MLYVINVSINSKEPFWREYHTSLIIFASSTESDRSTKESGHLEKTKI